MPVLQKIRAQGTERAVLAEAAACFVRSLPGSGVGGRKPDIRGRCSAVWGRLASGCRTSYIGHPTLVSECGAIVYGSGFSSASLSHSAMRSGRRAARDRHRPIVVGATVWLRGVHAPRPAGGDLFDRPCAFALAGRGRGGRGRRKEVEELAVFAGGHVVSGQQVLSADHSHPASAQMATNVVAVCEHRPDRPEDRCPVVQSPDRRVVVSRRSHGFHDISTRGIGPPARGTSGETGRNSPTRCPHRAGPLNGVTVTRGRISGIRLFAGRSWSGSDGTRTRDLRRDRPAL
jgi:hypothetical protein